MTLPRQTSRRAFLQQAGALSAAAALSAPALGDDQKSPNEKLNLAIVGVSNKGGHNLQQLTSQNIVALCDVDEKYLTKAGGAFPKATKHSDFRRMLEAEQKNIDAVVVSTADHTHAPATAIALDLGKHVYCEKPLTHTVQEARVVAELAKRNKLATQMGIQIHANDNYRRVVELVQGGAIGKVKEVYNWCNKGWSDGRFREPTPPPAHLNWDLWLGPAQQRPYSAGIHPGNWRRFWEYGSGTFGDMACHVMDLSFWAMDLKHPLSAHCEGPQPHADGAPKWVKATYEFPGEDGAVLPYHWSDGNAHFDLVKETKDYSGKPLSSWGLGVLFVGDKGMLVADYGRRQLLPKESYADFKPPEQTIPRSIGHWNEWVEGCKTGSPTTCNFEYAGALTETVLLGIVAFRAGEKLKWDAANLRATNCDDAEQYVKKEYRKGWKVVGT